MTTKEPQPNNDPKLVAELTFILRTFRIEGEKIIRISTGKEPKPTLMDNGYLYVRAGSKKDGTRRMRRWHRIVYAVHYRELHELIDHRDGNPLNNDISNLRPATRAQNAANARRPNQRLAKSGYRGVFQLPNGKFAWRVRIEGRLHKRKPFDTPEAAKEDREAFKKAMTGEHYHRSYQVRIKPPRGTVKKRTYKKPRDLK